MPDDVTDFVIVAESSYPPPPNPTFMIKLLQALVRGYPDRLKILYSAPVSSIVQFVMNLLLPLMPGRLASKVCLLTTMGSPSGRPGGNYMLEIANVTVKFGTTTIATTDTTVLLPIGQDVAWTLTAGRIPIRLSTTSLIEKQPATKSSRLAGSSRTKMM